MLDKDSIYIRCELDKAKKKIKIGGIYRHYKNAENQYIVRSVAISENDMKLVVVYEALYGDGFVWVRTVENWLEKVKIGDKFVYRFDEVR